MSFDDITTTLAHEAESSAIDAELLAHRCERMGTALIKRTSSYIWAGRIAMGITATAVGSSCLGMYYLNAQAYRVWRIRYPQRVRLCRQRTYYTAAFATCSLIALLYPNGYRAWLAELQDNQKAFDALAMRAFVARQNYATLYTWAKGCTSKKAGSSSGSEDNTKATHSTLNSVKDSVASSTNDEALVLNDEPSVASTAWSRIRVQLTSSPTVKQQKKDGKDEEVVEDKTAEQLRALEKHLMRPSEADKATSTTATTETSSTQDKEKEVYEWRADTVLSAATMDGRQAEELMKVLTCCNAAWAELMADFQQLAKRSGVSTTLM